MISIIASLFDGAKFGIPHSTGIYDESWADKLYRGLKRNTKIPFELVVLVDREYNFTEPIRQVPFALNYTQNSGWALQTEKYRPDLTKDWRVCMGLDTIITGNIDNYLEPDKDFAMVTDPFFPNEVCNAMTWCSPATAQIIWNVWMTKQDWIKENCRLPPWNTVSEMVLLRKLFNKHGHLPCIDKLFPGVYSYKCHIIDKPELMDHTKILYFHGDPKPNDLGAYPVDEKIIPHWK